MTDYADKIAEQLVNQALVGILNSTSKTPIDWKFVVAAGVRAGYGYGFGARAMEDSK